MLAYLLIGLAILTRFAIALHWLPQAFHFTPLGAALLYFGARRSRAQMWVPVALLFATDVVLTRFVYHWPLTFEVFSSVFYYILAIFIGGLLKEKTTAPGIAGASMLGSITFFVISNLFVWADGGMYPLNFTGLIACFTAAIPFFRGTLAGDLVFSFAIFGTPMLLEVWQRRRAAAAVAVRN